MMGDDDVRLDPADDVADGEANLVVVRQQPILIGEHDRLASQLPGKGLRLGNFSPAVFADVRSGGGSFFTGGERQGDGLPPVDGAGGQQRPGGELRVPHMGTDGKNGMGFHFSHSSFSMTPNRRTIRKPAPR